MRVGYIDYLNTYPLYWQIFDHASEYADMEIVAQTPGVLNRMMRAGELDLSPVSVACLPEIQADVHVLSDHCLGANGAVRSVLLLSQFPMEQLDGRVIGLTTASETSVVLLRYLLEQCYRLHPRYEPHIGEATGAQASAPDGVLLIGNEALSTDTGRYRYVYDLAELWRKQMGMPFVFAVFVVRRDVMQCWPGAVLRLRQVHARSLADARKDKPSFLQRAAQAYPHVKTDLAAYFESMKYDFTDAFRGGLARYFEVARQSGLLGEMRELSYV